MTPIRAPRWALSFADLCLLLLAFFVLLHARGGDGGGVADSMRSAFGEAAPSRARHYAAGELFEPGEAVLKPQARARLEALGRSTKGAIRISSTGLDPATHRLDRWELAAARVAAVARALRSGGLPEDRIELSMPRLNDDASGQRIALTPFAP